MVDLKHSKNLSAKRLGVTVGDGCQTVEHFERCIEYGVSLVRFNLANNTILNSLDYIYQNLMTAINKYANPSSVEVLFDIPYPRSKVRYNTFEGLQYDVKKDTILKLVNSTEKMLNSRCLYVESKVFEVVSAGDTLCIGDGELTLNVERVERDFIEVKANNDWFVSDSKSLLIFGKEILQISEKNENIKSIAKRYNGKKISIALSFVEHESDILKAKEIGFENFKSFYAKVETQKGVDNIDDITRAFDAVIVARGDLALYAGIEELGENQNKIIEASNKKNKPVFVATEIFSSLKYRDIPTRAEISDVYNLSLNIISGGFLMTKESSMNDALQKTLEITRKLKI